MVQTLWWGHAKLACDSAGETAGLQAVHGDAGGAERAEGPERAGDPGSEGAPEVGHGCSAGGAKAGQQLGPLRVRQLVPGTLLNTVSGVQPMRSGQRCKKKKKVTLTQPANHCLTGAVQRQIYIFLILFFSFVLYVFIFCRCVCNKVTEIKEAYRKAEDKTAVLVQFWLCWGP